MITVLLVVLILGIPLGYSWLTLSQQSLTTQATSILDEVRVDTDSRLASKRDLDQALFIDTPRARARCRVGNDENFLHGRLTAETQREKN